MANPLARSQITAGDFTLVIPIRPYTAQWGYQQNINSRDTIGGRVVQLLSVQVTDLQIESVAASRRELQRIATGIKRIMAYHVDTSLPAYYIVPSRNWKFRVFVRSMPQIGWQVETVAYPYSLTMAIQEDITGVKSKHILTTELTRLAEGIGYNSAVHGGDYKGFQKLVDSLLTAPINQPSGGGQYGGSPQAGATDSRFGGKTGLWPRTIANAPWSGKNLQDQIFNLWAAVHGAKVAHEALCIVQRESNFHPDAYNSYGNPIHYVYGLFQISDVHSASTWWPTSGVHGTNGGLMFDPEYNTRSAIAMWPGNWSPWSTAPQCGL